MPLPAALSSFLWSGPPSSLCGMFLGDVVDAAPLPDWWNRCHSDRATRYGWHGFGDGIYACCSVTHAHGRAKHVEVIFECNDGATEVRVFADVGAAVEERLGGPARRSKNKKELSWEGIAGAFKGDVVVRRAGCSSDYPGVELTLSLTGDEEIKADERGLFVDVETLAGVLQSSAWPKERAKEALTAWFRHEYPRPCRRRRRLGRLRLLRARLGSVVDGGQAALPRPARRCPRRLRHPRQL